MTSVQEADIGPSYLLAAGAFLLPIAWCTLNFVYWPAVLEAGLLPTHADSILIPIANDIIAAPFVMMLLLVWSWPAWRVAKGRVNLLVWDRQRPVTSWLATLAYGGVAAICAVDAVHLFLFLHPVELLNLIVTIPFALWNLFLRAAAVQPPNG